MKTEIKRILTEYSLDTNQTLEDATQKIMYLFKKRFNYTSFMIGIVIGIIICMVMIELVY